MTKYKVTTHVPLDSAELVREAVGKTGANRMGKYHYCSFSFPGTGRFCPDHDARPAVGQSGKLEVVNEECIEFVVSEPDISKVVEAIRGAHPYEEVPIEIVKLETF